MNISRTESAVVWLRLEGAAVLLGSAAVYSGTEASWLLFALLLFVPDLTMAGYLGGPRTGAIVYNLGHTYAAPAIVATAGWVVDSPPLLAIALIWTAHIGLDRALGYGLKLPTGFRETHLGPIGRG